MLGFPSCSFDDEKKEPNTLPRRSARAAPPRALCPAEGLPGTGIMRLVPGRRRPWWRWCEKRGGQRRLKGEKKKEENCEEERRERRKKNHFPRPRRHLLARSLAVSFFLSFLLLVESRLVLVSQRCSRRSRSTSPRRPFPKLNIEEGGIRVDKMEKTKGEKLMLFFLFSGFLFPSL